MKASSIMLMAGCLGLLAACDGLAGKADPSGSAAPVVATEPHPARDVQPPVPPVDEAQPDRATDAATVQLDQYARQATALSAALADGADAGTLKTGAESLMELAAGISTAFVQRHPHCAGYLEKALQVRARWTSLDHETIERDYHHDGVLPRTENANVCYHMKDLIVHPATMLVLLSQPRPDLAQARREIDEVIAHVGLVRAWL